MGNEASKAPGVIPGEVQRLVQEDITDQSFWSNEVFKMPWSCSRSFLRDALVQRPANVARLAREAVNTLRQAAADKFEMGAGARAKVLSAVAALTSLMPIMFESEHELRLVETIFWTGILPGGSKDEVPVPLSQPLMDAVLDLLCKPGLGCDTSLSAGASLAQCSVGRQCDTARTAVLKLLLTMCSESLYIPAEEYSQRDNKWLHYYATQPAEKISPLIASMLNTVCSYDPASSVIPYSSALVTDTRESLVEATLHALAPLLDYALPPNKPGPAKPGSANQSGVYTQQVPDTAVTEQGGQSGNSFREYLRTLSKPEDFDFLFKGLSKLIENPLQASSTYLPSSMKKIGMTQELLFLLWKIFDENMGFITHSIKRFDTNELITPILIYMCEVRRDLSKIGLIHMGTFIMLLLSGDRNFCVNLNAPFTYSRHKDLPFFKGNMADLVFVVFSRLFAEGSKQLESCYECWLMTLSNISSYIKVFCLQSASGVAKVFETYANPKRLILHESAYGARRNIQYLLEVFNNVIQYQYEGNPHLIYQILRRKKAFAELTRMAENPSSFYPSLIPTSTSMPVDAAHTQQAAELKIWAEQLPIQPCLRLLQHLHPHVEDMCDQGNVNDENVVVEFIKTTTMVGLLPVPHAIMMRKFQNNPYTQLWFTTYVWGICYVGNTSIFQGTKIRLFNVSYIDDQSS